MKIGKRIFVILIVLLHVSCNKNKGNDLKINGEVKEVHTINFSVKYDSLEKSIFDTITENKIRLNKKGKIQSTEIRIYVNNEYRLTTFSNFKYNWKGQLIREVVYNLPDSLGFNIDYIYRNRFIIKGLLEKVISIDTIDGYFSFIETYKYTPNSLLSEKKSLTIGKDKLTNDTITNDEATFIYDSNEKLIELKLYEDGNKIRGKQIYSYNTNGLRTSTIKFDKDNIQLQHIKYTYVFDSLQNWIEKQSFINDKMVEIQKRKIIY